MQRNISIGLGIVLGISLFGFGFLMVWTSNKQSDVKQFCLTNGYPEIVAVNAGDYFCRKKENGTDVLLPARL